MSKITKNKQLKKEFLEKGYEIPNSKQKIVQIVQSRGHDLHSVKDEFGNVFLVSMPGKFRKTIWVKRGQFLICDPVEEGDKVKGEIAIIVDEKHKKFLKEHDAWPKAFLSEQELNEETEESTDSDVLFENTNRRNVITCSESDSDTSIE